MVGDEIGEAQEGSEEPKKEAVTLGFGMQFSLGYIVSCRVAPISSILGIRPLGCEHLGPNPNPWVRNYNNLRSLGQTGREGLSTLFLASQRNGTEEVLVI